MHTDACAYDACINDKLLERARALTGFQEKTALVQAGLEALIAREAGNTSSGTRRDPTETRRRSAAAVYVVLLADTSVWIEHFRQQLPSFSGLLSEGTLDKKLRQAAENLGLS